MLGVKQDKQATPRDEDVCRCSLPWREATSPLERWMLPRRHTNATKSHPILPLRQHHVGVSQPLVVDLGVTNFSGGNHKGRFLSERLLPPRSLQPPRVTRTMGKKLKTCSNHEFLWCKEGEGVDLSLDRTTSLQSSQIPWGSKI